MYAYKEAISKEVFYYEISTFDEFRVPVRLTYQISVIIYYVSYTQGAEVTGQLRVNGKIRHLRRCTLEDQSLALKKHRVHKYVNTATICVSVINLFILT